MFEIPKEEKPILSSMVEEQLPELGAEITTRKGIAVPEVAQADLRKPLYEPKMRRVGVPAWVSRTLFRQVLAAVYHDYLRHGAFGYAAIAKKLSIDEILCAKIIDSPEFKHAASVRGMNIGGSGLTEEMDYLLLILSDPHDGLTMAQKLRKAGVTNTKYQGFMRQPVFRQQVEALSEQLLGNKHEALIMLSKKVGEGDLNSIKYQLEVNERYNPRKQDGIDSIELLARVVDIVTRNVHDPETLARLSLEFGALAKRVEPHEQLQLNQ